MVKQNKGDSVMIELFGQLYSCDREALKEATTRLINGAELTICYKEKEAYINKIRPDCIKIDYEIARAWVAFGIVGQDTGNLETGEEHYTYEMR